jgi:hypothetical protein
VYYRRLDPESLLRTIRRLRDRVAERFPGSGLFQVAEEFCEVARHSSERARWAAKPLLWLRAVMALALLAVAAGVIAAVQALRLSTEVHSVLELVQALESGVNDVIFVCIGIYFLVSLESRIKRARVLNALHELRALAHIIDMHQLTKDPDRLAGAGSADTPSSPERPMSRFELGRYLDYCSEMLALVGKIGALYAQNTSDPVALQEIDQIEDLTSGLAQKIGQKIVILHTTAAGASGPEPPL